MDNEQNSEKASANFEKAFFKLTIIQTILAIVGIMTGCIALYAALSESDAVRKQQQAIVLPILQMGISNVDSSGEKEAYKLTFQNSGIGPAVVKSVQLQVDEMDAPNWPLMFLALGVQENVVNEMQTGSIENRVISAGESVDAVFLKGEASQDLFSAFNNNYHRLSIKVCYCSVFDDCWRLDSKKRETLSSPEKVDSCPKG